MREEKRHVDTTTKPDPTKLRNLSNKVYDVIIVGSGTSGSFVASSLVEDGLDCLMLEAGGFHTRESYPESDVDSNARLYWSGGVEPNRDYDIGLLRPKCVGGGSVVNQALLDRFDEDALLSWREESGIEFFTTTHMENWYEEAERELNLEKIPEEHANRNAEIFKRGSEENDIEYRRLRRAQRDCRYRDGNDCIECLGGCGIDSKQSTPVTTLYDAVGGGLDLIPGFEVKKVWERNGRTFVTGEHRNGPSQRFKSRKLVLAAGAIGNSKILLQSGFDDLPVGKGFYCHPQRMIFGVHDEPVRAFESAFQAVASDDAGFREKGFKLENVFARPADTALLLPGIGISHQRLMKKIDHLSCIEVSVRDTESGRITLDTNGSPKVHKKLNSTDRKRLEEGSEVIRNLLNSSDANEVVEGYPNIGLHLMGGCGIGTDEENSVVSADFSLHGTRNIYSADSSVFPNAPGINPALTIMALSLKAAEEIKEAGI